MTALSRLRRVRVFEEPSTGFAVDNSANPADYLDVPVLEGSFSWDPGAESKEINIAQQSLYASSPSVPSREKPTVSMGVPFYTVETRALDGIASVGEADSALLRILKTVFGGIRSGFQGSTIVAVNSQSSFELSPGDGAQFEPGSGIGVQDINGRVEILEVARVTGDVVETRTTTSRITVAVGTEVANATTIYLADPQTSLQFTAEGEGQFDRYVNFGMQATSLGISTPIDESWSASFQFEGTGFDPLAAAPLQIADYEEYGLLCATGPFISANHSPLPGEPASDFCVQSSTVNTGFNFTRITCSNSESGTERWKANPQPGAISWEWQRRFPCDDALAAAEWLTARRYAEAKYFSQQQGTDMASGAIAIVSGQTQVTNWVHSENEGIESETISGNALADSIDGVATALSESPMRIHFV